MPAMGLPNTAEGAVLTLWERLQPRRNLDLSFVAEATPTDAGLLFTAKAAKKGSLDGMKWNPGGCEINSTWQSPHYAI